LPFRLPRLSSEMPLTPRSTPWMYTYTRLTKYTCFTKHPVHPTQTVLSISILYLSSPHVSSLNPHLSNPNRGPSPTTSDPTTHHMLALRPVFRTSSQFRPKTYATPTFFLRTMSSSSAAPLQEWLVIIPDHAGALQKRVAARPKHLEGLKSDREDMWLWGGTSSTFQAAHLVCFEKTRRN
jgi:hypothetical protein